jgi:hypothetical protein
MEHPSIPRMPPYRWRVFWLGIMAFVLELVLADVFDSLPWLMFAIVGAVYSVVFVFIWGRRGLVAWRVRRVVHHLRRFDAAKRATILGGLDDEQTQAYFDYRLGDHGAPEVTGLVERFTFSPVDRQEMKVAMWGSTLAAFGISLPVAILDLNDAMRAIAFGVMLLLVMIATMLRRGLSRLQRDFEVSPFGLSEIVADGTVRRLFWGYGLTLRNRRWLRRIELSHASDRAFIDIPYSVVGFKRLVELVLTKGGFTEAV